MSVAVIAPSSTHATEKILNASFDISRELYKNVAQAYQAASRDRVGSSVEVENSHAGSSSQARSILEGLDADVVTFNTVADIERLADGGAVSQDWRNSFPNNAVPYTSVHVILVRKSNPKNIQDWSDLARDGVEVVQVNPKTGGNGRYAVQAYFADALKKSGGDDGAATAFLKKVLSNVVLFEKGGRAATLAFTERGIGDALVTFESEALQLANGPDSEYEVVTPSTSLRSDFPVAVVERVVNKRGSQAVAKDFLDFLYTDEGQKLAGQNFYRPINSEIQKEFAFFKPVEASTIAEIFGDETAAHERFFKGDGLFDEIIAEIGNKAVVN